MTGSVWDFAQYLRSLHPFRDGAREDAVSARGDADTVLPGESGGVSADSRSVGVGGICHGLGNELLKIGWVFPSY